MFYELLAVEFVRNLDKMNLNNKASILFSLASADIEAINIIKSAHMICASTLEALKLSHSEE